ncbi:MAG: pyruvate kinase [Deltaproteobacteria bacterium]|nr:pyruvate kinase [Deltaproteobacteria bacterium]
MRRARILATVGPASREGPLLDALLAAGVDGFRVNFSHGTAQEHRETVARIRLAEQRAGRFVAVLGDLSGPKIRCGTFPAGPVELIEGQRFTLTTRAVPGDITQVSCTYPLWRDLRPGDAVLLDDGLLRLRAVAIAGEDVTCVVEVAGPLSDRKGINVPGATLSTPALTPKDRQDALLAQELGVDFLALSFVRRPQDLADLRQAVPNIPLIAKIEKPEAVSNLDAITDVADGIMVARGDLGVELGSEKVPLVQKRAIRVTNDRNKLVITATQMLDSMIRSPRPTRAEAADVANAVLDGSDVLMLSGETAAGRYPLEAVRTMDAIIREIEASDLYWELANGPSAQGATWDFASACAAAAAFTARNAPLAGIIVFSHSGHTVNLVAEHRPRAPIVAVTPEVKVARRLALQWGTLPVVEAISADPTEVLAAAERLARSRLGARDGDTVGVVVGSQRSSGTKAFILDTLGRPPGG